MVIDLFRLLKNNVEIFSSTQYEQMYVHFVFVLFFKLFQLKLILFLYRLKYSSVIFLSENLWSAIMVSLEIVGFSLIFGHHRSDCHWPPGFGLVKSYPRYNIHCLENCQWEKNFCFAVFDTAKFYSERSRKKIWLDLLVFGFLIIVIKVWSFEISCVIMVMPHLKFQKTRWGRRGHWLKCSAETVNWKHATNFSRFILSNL